jgi:hypothetical protein
MTDLFKEKALDWDVNDMVKALSSVIGAAIKANVTFNDTMHVMDFGARHRLDYRANCGQG